MTETKNVVEHYYEELITFLKASKEVTDNTEVDDARAQNLVNQTSHYYKESLEHLTITSERQFGEPGFGTKVHDKLAETTAFIGNVCSGITSHGNSKKVRDIYVNLTASACGLQMLYATVRAQKVTSAGSRDLLQLLKAHNALVMKYNELLPELVIKELAEKSLAL